MNDPAAKPVKAYPNPVRDVLHIENPDARIESVALYNLLGQKVAEAKTGANVIDVDVSSLERGYYILETSGGNTSRMKIAKY